MAGACFTRKQVYFVMLILTGSADDVKKRSECLWKRVDSGLDFFRVEGWGWSSFSNLILKDGRSTDSGKVVGQK